MSTPHLWVVGNEDNQASRKAPALTGVWTADELMKAEFPQPKWAVPGLIAEGVSLLTGPPKVGKSWLSLGIALAVATGGKALDMIPVEAGPVLYLALEDVARRLQDRTGIVLGGQTPHHLRNLTFATGCPPLTQGGDAAIAAWLTAHLNARMVIIDVFAKVRGNSAPGASAYDADYAAVSRVKRIADHFGVAIVLVHHVRKQGSEDFLAEVSGTNGIAGAADTTIVLKRARGQADGILHITGRDVDETEMALRFHPAAGAWQLLDGPAQDFTLGETRSTVLSHLRANPQANTPKMIADACGIAYDTIKKTCQRMANDGQLNTDGDGRYRALGGVPSVPLDPSTDVTSDNDAKHQGQSTDPAVPSVPLVQLAAFAFGEEVQP